MKERFELLKQEVSCCRKCQDMFGYEPRPIIQGEQNSLIMQISQAPSRKVMETGKPFQDMSGQKLIFDWYQITREQLDNPFYFYITSVGKCYPGKAKTTGDNPPSLQCAHYFLKRELEIIEPQIYIVIGSYAAKYFFPDQKFEDLVFKDHFYKGKPLFVLPHPSPLNRKWLKDHPQFEKERIVEIRNLIHQYIK